MARYHRPSDNPARDYELAKGYFPALDEATGDVYESAGRWVMRLRVRDNDGNPYSTTSRVDAPSKTHVERVLLGEWVRLHAIPELLGKARANGASAPETTLVYWIQRDLDASSMKANSMRTLVDALRLHVEPHEIGSMPITAITAEVIEDHLRSLTTSRGPASQSTQKKVYSLMGRGFHRAHREGVIQADPRVGVKPKYFLDRDNVPDKPPAMTPADLGLLMQAAELGGHFDTLMMLKVASETGLRLGELLALAWDDFDTDTNGVQWLNVRRAARQGEGNELITTAHAGSSGARTKSSAGLRRLPVASELTAELAVYRLECGPTVKDHHYLFNWELGAGNALYRPSTVSARLRSVGQLAGLCQRVSEPGKGQRWVPLGGRSHVPGWHQIRRMFASRLSEMPDVTPVMLMNVMGWASIEMAEVYYRHSADTDRAIRSNHADLSARLRNDLEQS